jgi:hypothetical protein
MQFAWYQFWVSLPLKVHSLVLIDDPGPLLYVLNLVGVAGLLEEMMIGDVMILLLPIRLLTDHPVVVLVGIRCGSRAVLTVDECGCSSSCGPSW